MISLWPCPRSGEQRACSLVSFMSGQSCSQHILYEHTLVFQITGIGISSEKRRDFLKEKKDDLMLHIKTSTLFWAKLEKHNVLLHWEAEDMKVG